MSEPDAVRDGRHLMNTRSMEYRLAWLSLLRFGAEDISLVSPKTPWIVVDENADNPGVLVPLR